MSWRNISAWQIFLEDCGWVYLVFHKGPPPEAGADEIFSPSPQRASEGHCILTILCAGEEEHPEQLGILIFTAKAKNRFQLQGDVMGELE